MLLNKTERIYLDILIIKSMVPQEIMFWSLNTRKLVSTIIAIIFYERSVMILKKKKKDH